MVKARKKGAGGAELPAVSGSGPEVTAMKGVPMGELVLVVREVVGERCTDEEIRHVLLECRMDADDAAQRLLSLDMFQKVKSKRKRRKEKGGDRGHLASDTSDKDHGTATKDIENELAAPSTHGVKITDGEPSPHSDNLKAFSASSNFSTGHNVMGSGSQIRCPGKRVTTSLTTTDAELSKVAHIGSDSGDLSIVYAVMEPRPRTGCPDAVAERSGPFQDGDPQKLLDFHPKQLHGSSCDGPELQQDSRPIHFSDQQTASVSSISSATMAIDFDQSSKNTTIQKHEVEEVQLSGLDADRNIFYGGSSLASSSHLKDENAASDFHLYADDLSNEMASCFHGPVIENQEALLDKSISLAAASLQELSLMKAKGAPSQSNDDPSVVFPNSMQNLTAACSHIHFGTFQWGKQGSVTVSFNPSNDQIQAATSDGLSSLPLDTRSSEFMDENLCDNQLGSFINDHQLKADIKNMYAASQVQLNISELATEQERETSLPVPDYHLKRFQDFSSGSVFVSPDARNLPPFLEELHTSSASIPVHHLTSSMESSRHPGNSFSFPATFSALRYTRGLSSAKAPASSMSEILCPGASYLPHSYSEIPGTANLTSRPVLLKHFPMQSQFNASFPAEESANGNWCSVMPERGVSGLSALFQSYPDAGMFHNFQVRVNCVPQEVSDRTSTFTGHNVSCHGGFRDPVIFPRSLPMDCQCMKKNNPAMLPIGSPAAQGSLISSRATLPVPGGLQYKSYQEQRQLIPRYERSQQQYQNYSSSRNTNFYPPQIEFAEGRLLQSHLKPSSEVAVTSKQQK